jgi:putative aldouronate transport system permease protein
VADIQTAETKAELSDTLKRTLRMQKWARARKMKTLYLLFLFPAVSLLIFKYLPIYGIIIAFKDFSIYKGIWASEWAGFANFKFFFGSMYFWRILKNTVVISLMRLIFGFPAPILLAILINEMGNLKLKKIVQSISYLPHFMSWVVLASIITEILSPQRGIVAFVYTLFGATPPNFLIDANVFRPMLIITGIWREIGWGTVIYLAALAGINPELYESAAIDGANRFRMAAHITIPCLVPVMTILFILRLGRILNAGFEQILNLYNPLVYEVADIIDTFVYRVGLLERRYDYGAAVGLFKNAIGISLVLGSNAIIRKFNDYGIW